MTEQIKSIIRHGLTAIGLLLVMVGLDKYVDLIEYIQSNLDAVTAAITTLVGVGTAIYGFFRDGDRLKEK